MALSTTSHSPQQNPDQAQDQNLELLFSFYLLGRKIKHQVKTAHHNQQVMHDQMLELAILTLVMRESRSVSELAQLLSTGLSAMSERIKLLKDQGLLDQVSGTDGREMRCVVTTAGQSLLAETRSKMQRNCTQFTQALTQSEIITLNQLIQKLLAPAPQAGKTSLQ